MTREWANRFTVLTWGGFGLVMFPFFLAYVRYLVRWIRRERAIQHHNHDREE